MIRRWLQVPLEKGRQLGMFALPAIGGSTNVRTHVRRGPNGLEIVQQHERHEHRATVPPPATTDTPTTATGDGESPIVESTATIEIPMPSASLVAPPTEHATTSTPPAGVVQPTAFDEETPAGPVSPESTQGAPTAHTPPGATDTSSTASGNTVDERITPATSAGRPAKIVDEIPEKQLDTATRTVHVDNLELVRAKAKALGLEIEELPVSADSVLSTLSPAGWDDVNNVGIYSAKQEEWAKKHAEKLRHILIKAPKHTERIVGIAKLADGPGGEESIFSNVRTSKDDPVYFDKTRVSNFDFKHCDECGRKIQRGLSFIVRDKDGHHTQIGGQCAANLNLAQKLKNQLDAFEELTAFVRDRENSGMRDDTRFSPARMLAGIEWSRRKYGYITGQAAERMGHEGRSTAGHAMGTLNAIDMARSGKVQLGAEEKRALREADAAISKIEEHQGEQLHADVIKIGQEAFDKLADGQDATFAHNLKTATKGAREKHAGLLAFALHKRAQKIEDELSASRPRQDYTPEPASEKLKAEPPAQLAAKLGVEPRAIEKALTTGKLPKTLENKLERYLPGTWRVLNHRTSEGNYGTTHHYDLQRLSDGSVVHWSSGTPAYSDVHPRWKFSPHAGRDKVLDDLGNVSKEGEGHDEVHWAATPHVGEHLEIHGAQVDEKPGEKVERGGRTYHNARKINRVTAKRVEGPTEDPAETPAPLEPAVHFGSAAYLNRPGERRAAVDKLLAEKPPEPGDEPAWAQNRDFAAPPEWLAWSKRVGEQKQHVNALRSHYVDENGTPEPGYGWEGADVRPTDKPEHVHPRDRHLLPMTKGVRRPIAAIELGPNGPVLVPMIKAELTTHGRNQIAAHNFALSGGRYPIHDEAHARNALARVAQFGTAEEQAEVRAAVRAKYPGIDVSGSGETQALEKAFGSMPRPQGPPPMVTGVRPPADRVQYRHPGSGEIRSGKVQAGGEQGISLVDEQDGTLQRVPHGHYVVHPDEDKGGPPLAPGKGKPGTERPTPEEGTANAATKADADSKFARLKHTAEQLPAHRAQAHKEMRLGPDSHVAHKAAAALLAAHTGRPAHDLKSSQLDTEGDKVKVRRTPDQQDEVKDKHLAAFVGASKKGRKPDDPAFGGKDSQGNIKPVKESDVADHLAAHGDGMTPEDVSRYHTTREAAEAKGKPPAGRPPEHVDPKVAAAMKDHNVKMPDKPADAVDGDKRDDRERKFGAMLDSTEEADPTGARALPEGADEDGDNT
jgi:hypothetical protein